MNVKRGIFRTALIVVSAMLLLAGLWGCGSPTPTPLPTATLAPTAEPTATPIPTTGPWTVAFDDLVVELVAPAEVPFGHLGFFHLAFSNAGSETLIFYHGTDLAEFIVTKDGVQLMTSWDQLSFGDISYTNELAAGKTRRFETGFNIALFEGALVDTDFEQLPVGEYEVYGVARMSSVEGEEPEQFRTPAATLRIVEAP